MTDIVNIVVERLDDGNYVAVSGNMKGLYARAPRLDALEEKIKDAIADIYSASRMNVIVSRAGGHTSDHAATWVVVPAETARSELKRLGLYPTDMSASRSARDHGKSRQSQSALSAENFLLRRSYRAAR